MNKLGCFTITTLAFFATALASATVEAACGQFEVAKGDVKVLSGTTKQAQAAVVGTKICSGDAVVAGKDSRAKLRMEDGNELNVSPDSKIILETYQFDPAQNKKKVLLNVLQGKVRAATKQENMYNDKSRDGADNTFQVKTKSAVAGVRGTDFLTGFDTKTGKSEVVTFRGKVDVGQPGPGGQILNPVQVGAGQKTEASMGQAPSVPRSVPPRELQQMNSDTKGDASANSGGSANTAGEKKDDKREDKKDEKKTADKSGEKHSEKQAGPKDSKSSGSAANNSGGSRDSGAASGTPTAGGSIMGGGAEPSSSSSGANASTGGSSSSPSAGDSRQPSSTSAPPPPKVSLISNSDLGTGSGPMTSITPVAPQMPMVPVVTTPTALPVVPVCQQCLDAVSNSPTKLNVRIKIQ